MGVYDAVEAIRKFDRTHDKRIPHCFCEVSVLLDKYLVLKCFIYAPYMKTTAISGV